ncbi:12829_t:CDS:2 [Cetraspora pellucida]|uniref:12829_t:CDS:1 n=1 Tax=Cetraspora pellucida TaxID=1433469 RepID=A0ACA9LXR6_9GLOM|nr:12829_t:CDS:2 [Cetraspora pellucida]
MSTTSTSAPSTPVNNIKNLAYNILKTFKDSIIKEFVSKKTFTYNSKYVSIFGCSEEVEIIITGHRRGSKSKNLLDVDDNEDSKGNHPTDQNIIPLEKESCKRPNKDTSENKLSSKKVKNKDENVSMLKKLIEKLKSSSSSTSSTTSQAESITSPSNFFDLYSAILKKRLTEYMKDNKECRSQRKLYKEVKKQLPSNLSKNAIEKRIERARKIYDLFSNIDEDKIQWVRSYSALRISKLSWDEIDAIEEEFE